MPTFKKIASTVTTSDSGFLTFSSIPSTYKDLFVRCLTRSAASATTETLWCQINNDGASNYVYTRTILDGSGGLSQGASGGAQWFAGSSANTGQTGVFGVWDIYISEYANTNFQHSAVAHASLNVDNNTADSEFFGYLYKSSTAISSITIKFNGPNFKGGSSFYLYGI